jgi:hypothetical protein
MRKFLIFPLLFCSIGCFSISCSDMKNSKNLIVETPIDSTLITSQKKIQLIETILNLPGVIKLSKFETIKKARPNIYILLKENLFPDPVPIITQNGYQLTVLRSLGSLDTSTQPVYVFTRMEVKENAATVQMLYDITGLWVNGRLNYVEGKWIPDEELMVVVR